MASDYSDYDECIFKVPIESKDYMECSDFVVEAGERLNMADVILQFKRRRE